MQPHGSRQRSVKPAVAAGSPAARGAGALLAPHGTREPGGLWWGLPLESAGKEGFGRKKGIALAMVSSR